MTGDFVFTFRASDEQLLLTSPSFSDKDTALRRIASARMLARRDRNYEIYSAEGRRCYFELKNNSGELLGSSNLYPDEQTLQKAILSTKSFVRACKLLDLTGSE